jgi:hypothetical protein
MKPIEVLTEELLNDLILTEQYHHFPGTTMTVCCLTLQNGYHLMGDSSCVIEDEFSLVGSSSRARNKAVEKLWALEGYLMRQAIHEEEVDEKQRRAEAKFDNNPPLEPVDAA